MNKHGNAKDSWSTMLTNKPMTTKKQTELQKIKQKYHQQGYELGVKSRNKICKYWEDKYHDSIKKMEEIKHGYCELEHRIEILEHRIEIV
jgi:hypothetical protein